jgi:hypothetical protein
MLPVSIRILIHAIWLDHILRPHDELAESWVVSIDSAIRFLHLASARLRREPTPISFLATGMTYAFAMGQGRTRPTRSTRTSLRFIRLQPLFFNLTFL